MFRSVLVLLAMMMGAGIGWGQGKRPDPEGKTPEQYEKEARKWMADQRAAHYKKYPTELPDLLAQVVKPGNEQWAPTADVAEAKGDSPVVVAAKRAIRSELKRLKQIEGGITSGHFSGGTVYLQFTDCATSMYEAAAVVWDDPEKLLPFAENAVVSLMRAEEFNMPRVWQGVEEPQLLPQLTAARCRAEAVALKLREQISARSSPVVPPRVMADACLPSHTVPCGCSVGPCQVRVVRRPLLGLLCGRR